MPTAEPKLGSGIPRIESIRVERYRALCKVKPYNLTPMMVIKVGRLFAVR